MASYSGWWNVVKIGDFVRILKMGGQMGGQKGWTLF